MEEKYKEIQSILKELGLLDDAEENYYIYGAANNAEWLLQILKKLGMGHKIKGFLVTDMAGNPTILEGFPVFDVHEFGEREIGVLVPHAGIYKCEIFSLLKELNYKKVFSALKLMHIMNEEKRTVVLDEFMVEAEKWKTKLDAEKTEREKENDKKLIEKIIKIQKKGNPDFGGFKFYQGLEEIGIQGIRPTRYRILKYGIHEILKENYKVLDIGCNSGFLDMAISGLAANVTGIEYDSSLVSIAECVKEYLEIENCVFVNADFNDWYKENEERYEVIFSFAIHHWLNLKPEDYIDRLDKLLKTKGFIFIESHDLTRKEDNEYDDCVEALLEKGYILQKKEEIIDDGVTRRNFAILYKK